MRKLFFFIVVILIVGCQPKEDLPIEIGIDSNWKFSSHNSNNWQEATVPGNVFTDLLANHQIPDPFIKTNEEKVQWVSDSIWVYKTQFVLDKNTLSKKHITLQFDGIDTYAEIFINDKKQLTTNNAFRQYEINAKNLLKEKNELTIIFYPTHLAENKKKSIVDYELPEGNRIFTRKAQFQYGWDWGPKLNTAGIWKDIKIIATNNLIIKDVYIIQENLNDSIANLTCKLDLKYNNTDGYTFELYVNDSLTSISTDGLQYSPTYIPFEIKNPKRWWPHNIGKPYLYDIRIDVKEGNTLIASKNLKKGLRTIELITEKDSIGESFYFKVNGVPVYAKGANYIPQNSFQNKVTPAHYENLLNDVVDANMNMLRVWGGGIYENDIFYELCDEKGILVWQDFMFACAMYPGDTKFLNTVAIEAEQQVKRLRNYASIALWAGNNENSEGWHRWGWQDGRPEEEKKEIWKNYLKVFDSILPKTVKELSQTSYWESSPKFGRGNPTYEFEGDAHDWWVWHDAAPFEHFEKRVPRFMSEFGFQSFPSSEVLKHINQSKEIDLKTDAIKSHQKHIRGFQLIDEYMNRDYTIPTNDEDYAYVSQLLQAKGITMGIEAHRRAKPYNMGTLFWQLNDCWPAISWSSIDYFGNWKALQYKAKKSFENVLISSILKEGTINTFIVNDNLENLDGDLVLTLLDFNGKTVWSDTKKIQVKANTSEQFHQLPVDQFDKKNVVLVAEFNGTSSLFYLERPKNLQLQKAPIQQTITKTQNGFSIALSSTTLQKGVFLFSNNKGFFEDNFFDLLPNEKRVIEFKTGVKNLNDLEIKSLNSIY